MVALTAFTRIALGNTFPSLSSHSQSWALCWTLPQLRARALPLFLKWPLESQLLRVFLTKWFKEAVLRLLTLVQSLNISQQQTPRGNHSVGLNQHLLPQAHLWFFIVRNWTQMNTSLHHYTWVTPVNLGTTADTFSHFKLGRFFQNWFNVIPQIYAHFVNKETKAPKPLDERLWQRTQTIKDMLFLGDWRWRCLIAFLFLS